MKRIGHRLKEQKGAVAVLMVAALATLMGLSAIVVDVGYLYVNRAQLVSVADSSALAGVQDLPGDAADAVSSANTYAAKNGQAGDHVTASVGANSQSLTVQATRQVKLLFARIFGIPTSQVSASATAAVQPISAATGVVPFGIVWQNFLYGQSYTLKEGAGSGYHGNYSALALGGNGANNYRDNIKYGYDGKLKIGDWISTEPGNMSGPTSKGVDYRVDLDRYATFETVKRNSGRIVTVPVIAALSGNGRSEVQIVGFAAFFLEGVGGQGNNNVVSGKFMQMVMPGDTVSSGSGYGLYGIKLIQ